MSEKYLRNQQDFIDIILKTKYNITMSWGVRDSRYFEPTNYYWDSESTGLCPASWEVPLRVDDRSLCEVAHLA